MPTNPTLLEVQTAYFNASSNTSNAVTQLSKEISDLDNKIEALKTQKVDAEKKASEIDGDLYPDMKKAFQKVVDQIDAGIAEKQMIKDVRTAQKAAWNETTVLFNLLSTYNPLGSQGVQGV